jgi:hypothetical protein
MYKDIMSVSDMGQIGWGMKEMQFCSENVSAVQNIFSRALQFTTVRMLLQAGRVSQNFQLKIQLASNKCVGVC